jgi:hypothetical protein
MVLQPYSHDCFSKISRTFFSSRNYSIIVVFLQRTRKEKVPFILINTLLLHIPLLALNHRQTEWLTEKQIHLLRVGWRNFFPVVLLCQFFGFWWEIGFGVTCLHISRVQYSCGVVLVFWFWQEIVFGITYVLSVQYTCAVMSVFWLWQEIVLWREIVLKMRTPFHFLWAVSMKKFLLVYFNLEEPGQRGQPT